MPIRPALLFALIATVAIPLSLAQSSPPSLKTNAKIVIVDVVVTDAKQNPVHNLTASDFTLFENNSPERIKSFEEHSATAAINHDPPLNLPPGTFTNYTSVPADAPLNILLLDTLNTPNDAQTYVRNQLRLFLKKAPLNVPLAIFGLNTHLWLLQPFTADPRLLQAAVDHKSPNTSPLLENAAIGDKKDNLSVEMQEAHAHIPPYIIQRMQQFEAEHSSDDLQSRARYTLDALNQLARYLGGLPGRKNLIWFSGSFPITILPDGNLLHPFAIAADSSDKFRQTTALLAHSQVAVYPIDARGLTATSVYSVEDNGRQYDTNQDPNKTRNQDSFTNHLNDSIRQNADDNSTMFHMAEQTGGHAFINTNGLADAVARSIEAGSNYYTLTYSPGNAIDDGKFHKIQLKIQRQGLTLAYRRGYYADAPVPAAVPTVAADESSADPMHDVMIFGSPGSTQITLKVLVVPAAGKAEESVASGNLASARLTGPYRRYDITIAANPSDIVFTRTPDGNQHASLLFRTYLYTHDGKLLNTSSRVTEMDLTPPLYAQALHTGLFLHQEISAPFRADGYLRIGVHDVTGDRDGTLEVAIASVKNLPPNTLAPTASPLSRRQEAPTPIHEIIPGNNRISHLH